MESEKTQFRNLKMPIESSTDQANPDSPAIPLVDFGFATGPVFVIRSDCCDVQTVKRVSITKPIGFLRHLIKRDGAHL